jgi:amino-acid N-acetyltransferase
MTVVEKGRGRDFADVAQLLQMHQLPLDGLRDHLDNQLVARRGGVVIGSAAIELYKRGALLRSVAVAPDVQGSGVGGSLVEAAVDVAWNSGVPALHLLTTTGVHDFPRFGFVVIGRQDVPADVQRSVEFTSACPDSATVMRTAL